MPLHCTARAKIFLHPAASVKQNKEQALFQTAPLLITQITCNYPHTDYLVITISFLRKNKPEFFNLSQPQKTINFLILPPGGPFVRFSKAPTQRSSLIKNNDSYVSCVIKFL